MDERYDMMRSVMDYHWLYIRNYRPELPYVQPLSYMFQARGYQSWARGRGRQADPGHRHVLGRETGEELYDMVADPDNVRNLVHRTRTPPALEQMRAELRRRLLAIQ